MLVKVWNDNLYDHTEKFKGKMIFIPAGQSVEMEYDDAQIFLGQFTRIVKRGDGTADPRSFKKLRIEKDKSQKADPNPLLFHATGQVAKDAAELAKLVKAYAHLQPKDDDKDEATSGKIAAVASENEQLRKEMAELRAEMTEFLAAKRGRKRARPEEDKTDERQYQA